MKNTTEKIVKVREIRPHSKSTNKRTVSPLRMSPRSEIFNLDSRRSGRNSPESMRINIQDEYKRLLTQFKQTDLLPNTQSYFGKERVTQFLAKNQSINNKNAFETTEKLLRPISPIQQFNTQPNSEFEKLDNTNPQNYWKLSVLQDSSGKIISAQPNEIKNMVTPLENKQKIRKNPRGDISERSKYWTQAKERRIIEQQNDKRWKEIEQCTFRPVRITEQSTLAKPYEKAVENKNALISKYSNMIKESISSKKNQSPPKSDSNFL